MKGKKEEKVIVCHQNEEDLKGSIAKKKKKPSQPLHLREGWLNISVHCELGGHGQDVLCLVIF